MLNGIIVSLLTLVLLITTSISNNSCASANLQSESLIPRSVLFSDANYSALQISPNAKHISYLAPHNGFLNIWVGELGNLASMKPITDNKKNGVSHYYWSHNNEYIVYLDDEHGNENWRIYRVDIKTGQAVTLAAFDKVQARYIAASPSFPDEILIGLNQRRPEFHDIYRLNIRTGDKTLVYENNLFYHFICDKNLNLQIGLENTLDGGIQAYRINKNSSIKKLFKINNEDILTSLAATNLNKNVNTLFFLDGRHRNTAALVAFDLNSQKTKLIASDIKADISDVLFHPIEGTPQGYVTNYTKPKWTILDKTVRADIDFLKRQAKGELEIISRSLDDKTWIVLFYKDTASTQYYHYDRQQKKANFLFSGKSTLDSLPLTNRDPVVIRSRDNLPLICYLSLPKSAKKENGQLTTALPMVLLVHGGPNARDRWGYSPLHQWLANRGYAVLSVNYRGSTGFGKHFANAGNGEWGGKMQNDLLDAVNWAIKQGIASRDKIAIMGRSYGGYASLVGMTKTPEVFACGIDSVGVSNLETFIKSIPSYWKPYYARLKTLLGGDPDTELGRQFLSSRSPLTYVKNIKKPLLIEQGGNDPRVKQAESEQIVEAMQANHIPVTYVLFPDEGHAFRKPQNLLAAIAIEEAFLAQHLGGKFEPFDNDLKNSTAEIKVGGEYIKTLLSIYLDPLFGYN